MDADTLTAIAVIIAALTGLVTAVGVFVVKTRVEKVHVMVNSQREIMEARIEELGNLLRLADIDVPDASVKKVRHP